MAKKIGLVASDNATLFGGLIDIKKEELARYWTYLQFFSM
jgi:hypothetical protein